MNTLVRRYGYGAFAAAILLGANAAEAALYEFTGAATLLSATSGCAAQGWSAGNWFLARYHPPGILNNGTATRFSLFLQNGAFGFQLNTGSLIGTTFKAVTAGGIFSTPYSFPAQMRITSQSPASVSASTPALTFVGNINGFDGIGCNVQLRFSGVGRQH